MAELRFEGLSGLPPEAIPVSKLESGAVSRPAFDVRFGSKADIRTCARDVRFTPESGHKIQSAACPPSQSNLPPP